MTDGFQRALADARRGFGTAPEGSYRELMATYVQLGELLERGCCTPEDEEDFHDLVGRLIKLGEWVTREAEQRWAMWVAEIGRGA